MSKPKPFRICVWASSEDDVLKFTRNIDETEYRLNHTYTFIPSITAEEKPKNPIEFKLIAHLGVVDESSTKWPDLTTVDAIVIVCDLENEEERNLTMTRIQLQADVSSRPVVVYSITESSWEPTNLSFPEDVILKFLSTPNSNGTLKGREVRITSIL